MDIDCMIEQTEGICGGRPRLAGTRIAVHRVAGYYRLGFAPEEIQALLGSISLAQVHAALAYALQNVEEIDRSLRDEEEAAVRLTAESNPA